MVVGLAVAAPTAAQPTHLSQVEHFNERHGMSHNRANAVLQNRQGFIWVGTEDGLDRYDGYGFRRFAFPENSALQMDVIQLYEDRSGILWIATRHRIVSLDPETERLTSYERHSRPGADGDDLTVFDFVEDTQDTLWIATHDGVVTPDRSTQTLRRLPLVGADPEGPAAAAYDLAVDTAGRLWVGAEDGLYHRPAEGLEAVVRPIPERAEAEDPAVYRVLVDDRNDVWLGTFDGLWKLPADAGSAQRIVPAPTETASGDAGSASILTLGLDAAGTLWFLTTGGLHRRAPGQDVTTFPLCPQPPCLEYPYFNRYVDRFDAQGNLWIASGEGLLLFDGQRQQLEHHRGDGTDDEGLVSDSLYDLAIDHHGIVWLAGTAGLDKLDPRRKRFKSYSNNPRQGNLSGPGVWGIHQDAAGILWLGTYNDGLTRLDRAAQSTRYFRPDPDDPHSISGRKVTAITDDGRGGLWVGSHQGLDHFDPQRGHFTAMPNDPEQPDHLSGVYIFALHRDADQQLWVSTRYGVDLYQPATGTFKRCLPRDDEVPIRAYHLSDAHGGGIWAASYGRGLYRFAPGCETPPKHYMPSPDGSGLTSRFAVAVHQDTEGTVWIGFEDAGLDRWRPDDSVSEHFGVEDGLPSKRVLGITEDAQGFLWLATGRGLSRFDPRRRLFRNFDVGDGLLNNTFTLGSVLRGQDGELFFGGGLGLTALFPEDIIDDPVEPKVVLTDLQLFHESQGLASEDPDSPLQRSITATPRLTLTHRQYIVGIEMAPLHFANPNKNRLRYRLDDFNDDWVEVESGRAMAQYSNLEAGDYELIVQAANGDDVWSPPTTALRLHVLPAPWQTWWAYCLYALALLMALGLYSLWQRRRLAREQEINRQLRQVDRLKDEFLANTSHELRTPLYGITGLAESLLEGAQGALSAGARANLQMIVSSGQRLAGLVQQILDFSKVQQGKMELQRRPVDLSTLVDVVLAIVQPLIRGKDIRLLHRVAPNLPPALGDEDRLHQVLINLVGNAVKFTERGEVEVSAVEDDAMLTVRIRDTGIGIAADRQQQIFEAFEQADAGIERQHGGTGLGLAVSRELVTLLGGKLWVESTLGQGSTFAFTLPVAEEPVSEDSADGSPSMSLHTERTELTVSALGPWIDPDPDNPESLTSHLAEDVGSTADGGRGTSSAIETDDRALTESRILVVDDEPVLRQVLYNFLTPAGYDTVLAADGQEGLDLLALRNFDLVLLDVMMPGMSGFEVCTRIRRRFPAEELPVIFLTAKNQVSDLVRALGDGASDYLTKPIARQELLSRVRTHLALARAHRQQARQVNILTGLLPICASCKMIRDDEGAWHGLESYLDRRTEASFSHSICPNCVHELYPDVAIRPD